MAIWVDLDDDEVVYCGNRGEYENYNIPPEMIEHPADVVPVIRCKDCARCSIDTVYHDYWCDGKKVWKDHYCGYAERRTDEIN